MVREALGLKRVSSTLPEWLCSISTHTRTLTRQTGRERVEGSARLRLRPPAALSGRHHPEAGATPGSTPSSAFTGHLANGLDYQHPQGCPGQRCQRTQPCTLGSPRVPSRLLLFRPMDSSAPGAGGNARINSRRATAGSKGPHTPTWMPPPQPVMKPHLGAGGLPWTPLEAEGEDAGSSHRGAREKPGSRRTGWTEAWVAGSAAVFTFSSKECRCFAHFLLDSYLVNSKKPEPLCTSGVNAN